jgi:hypothetical protein
MDLVARSEELHARVRAFSGGDFEDLALAIADHQRRFSPGYARLVAAHGSALDSLASIPAVPTDAFRLTRVAVHPPELDSAAFITSGTTGAARGTHFFRSLETYRSLALRDGRQGLRVRVPATVACLATRPTSPPSSSLGFMMGLFQKTWDGRDARWLVKDEGVDVSRLEAACESASRRGEPLVVLSTAFALLALLDRLAGARLTAPADSVVMMTGGFKGRVREVEGSLLKSGVAQTFGIAPANVIGEYGMTELTSQLYEDRPDRFRESPTLRVTAVDAVTLEPVPDGAIGLAKIIDLGNVDSAVAIQTQDRVRRVDGGIELLGRAPGAAPRGCSLALEALLT